MDRPFSVSEWIPEVSLICDPVLRDQVDAVWQRLWNESRFNDPARVPISPHTDLPHIPHNRSVVQMALSVVDVLESVHGVHVDRDHLLAAALLQDASKLVELEPSGDGNVVRSATGQRYQHGFYAAHVALAEGMPAEIVEAILGHTPEAPGFPTALITKVLYYVDQIDMAALGIDRWKKTGVVYR